jgi:hypothetical protein
MPMPLRRSLVESEESHARSYRDSWWEETPEFRALSYRDRWRVRLLLARGKAPTDPRLAAATVEIAEQYKGHGRIRRAFLWLLIILTLAAAILDLLSGDTVGAILYALLTLAWALHLRFNPAFRPKNVARSLEASQRIVDADGGRSARSALPARTGLSR